MSSFEKKCGILKSELEKNVSLLDELPHCYLNFPCNLVSKNYFNCAGILWIILITLSMLPHLTYNISCPSGCTCQREGKVLCMGDIITDIPWNIPMQTYTLLLSDTNMTIINEKSLENWNLLLRFSLTSSHLHIIHPRAFQVAPQLRSLKLSMNDLSTLPAQVFSPLTTLQQLFLDKNQLETIAPDMFKGLVKLTWLDLSHNKLTSPASDVFNDLTSLLVLNLGRNSIKMFPPAIFHSLIELRCLWIYHNELEDLKDGIFDGLVNLEELKIHHNQIASLPPQVFWSLRNLNVLTLSSNQLHTIPDKSFYNMPKMIQLTLYSNPLLSLPEQLMGHMPNITDFYLYGTNLTTVPGNLFANMSGLLLLNFHLNDKLRELPPDLFCCLPNLETLSLRSNDLHQLHPHLFSNLTTLTKLLLNGNKLQILPDNIFQGLRGLLTIDLHNNSLMTLPGDIFSTNTALKNLTLQVNLWDCTCRIRGIARWIRLNQQMVLDKENVRCHSPSNHQFRTLYSLRDEEFNYCDATTSAETSAVTSMTIPSTTIPLVSNISPYFYEKLVVEQGSEFIHHSFHKDWVYVWFLPSDTSLTAFLMFCHILLVATGLLLILTTIYGIYRLSKTMEQMKAEWA